jgi:transposase
MGRGSAAPAIELSTRERTRLEDWSRRRKTAQALALRARIILASATGKNNVEVARELRIQRGTVGKWRTRFSVERLDGLLDEPRPGAPRKISDQRVEQLLVRTLESQPADATHWSTRSLAKVCGLSHMSVARIWRAFSLQPHRSETFKLSKDPLFIEKVRDIVGLYLNPPDHALVLCVDEKSQIQALDRTQPSLPLKKGRCGTMTHDYKRHGTTTLFAALDMLEGRVISECMPRHRHQEWIRFLDKIDRETPPGFDLHLIVDNYSTHKHAKVQRWLARHPRFHMHFIPTSSSWLNMVERFFRELTTKRIRRGSFASVDDLIAAICDYIDQHNENPLPYIWTATAESIIAKVGRARLALNKSTTV